MRKPEIECSAESPCPICGNTHTCIWFVDAAQKPTLGLPKSMYDGLPLKKSFINPPAPPGWYAIECSNVKHEGQRRCVMFGKEAAEVFRLIDVLPKLIHANFQKLTNQNHW
ncbi:hypothetical protein [Vampirovibrio sp.]|uniref:hypothetical protein n=1 Tax=Vampirovibrio sp. TaxID=2717857 RepID=UPI003593D41C